MQKAAHDKHSQKESHPDQTEINTPEQLNQECGCHNIIGQSSKMCQVFELVGKVADCDSTILINGETGTGKGLVAQAIHQNSKRSNKPFISINCDE